MLSHHKALLYPPLRSFNNGEAVIYHKFSGNKPKSMSLCLGCYVKHHFVAAVWCFLPWHFNWLCFSFVCSPQNSCGFYRSAQSVSECSRLRPLASLTSALADVHPARQYVPRIERRLDLSADSSPAWLVPLLLLLLVRRDRWLYLLFNYCGETNHPSVPRCMRWKHWLYLLPGRKLTNH